VTQTGTWTSQTTPNASGGSYLYSSGNANDTLSLEFYGTRIEVVYVAHPSFGSFTVEIDNNEIRTVTAESKETLFDQRAVFDYLDAGPHTLRIMGIQGVVGIDAFIASQSQVVMPTATPLPYNAASSDTITTPLPTTSAESFGASSSQSQSFSIGSCDAETAVSDVVQLLTAVNAANLDPDSNTVHCIFLQPGTYSFVLATGQNGALVINHNINFFGLDYPENVILDGMDQGRIMYIQGGQVEIHHLHLTNGVHQGSSDRYGGAIRMNNGQLVVTDSIFSSNGDMADTNGGGAIFGGGTVTRTQFIGNEAGGGGAIQHPGGGLEITNSCFHNNKAIYGGAILNTESGAGVDISESAFVGNIFTDYTNGGGGAIFNLSTIYMVEAVGNYWASWSTSIPPIEGPAHSPIRDIPPANANDPSTFTDTINIINGDINLDSADEGSEDDILTIKPNCLPEIPIDFPDDDVVKPYHIPDIEFDTAFEDLDPDRFPARCQFTLNNSIDLYSHPDLQGNPIATLDPSSDPTIVPFAYWEGRGINTTMLVRGGTAPDYELGWANVENAVAWSLPENQHPELSTANYINDFDDPALATSPNVNVTYYQDLLGAETRCENAVYVVCRYHVAELPTANLTVSSTFEEFQLALAEYGITIYEDGVSEDYIQNSGNITLDPTDPTATPSQFYADYHRYWNAGGDYGELLEILRGVETTASAFSIMAGCPDVDNDIEDNSPQALFRRVMGEFTILRVNDGFYQHYDSTATNRDPCYGSATQACTDNYRQTITFYGDLTPYGGVDQYTTVHEMGHRFNARSDGVDGRTDASLYGRLALNDAPIVDFNIERENGQGKRVTGYVSTSATQAWVRGERGWGTGPAYLTSGGNLTVFTSFQKNPFQEWVAWSSLSATQQDTRRDETIADMFLNWVYRTATVSMSREGGQGFQNRKWWDMNEGSNGTTCLTTEGCLDITLPGYARFEWMETQMYDIFDQRGWR
jgi:hypothetical protein